MLMSCSSTSQIEEGAVEGQITARFVNLTAAIAHSPKGITRKSRVSVGKYQGIRSVLISQHNELIYEQYFNDGSANKAINMASLGKSLLSAMVGIAIDKGIIRSVDESIYSYFPYTSYADWSEKKADLQIKHLLTMSPGWQCGNISNYSEHCGAKMLQHKDSLKWLLDLPMQAAPGKLFNYNDAVPHVLVAILAQATKRHPSEFFKQHLQNPLGLENNLYDRNRLTSRDMLKIGQLYLQKGTWQGKQLISRSWIEKSTRSHVNFEQSQFAEGYGFLWWQKTFNTKDALQSKNALRSKDTLHVKDNLNFKGQQYQSYYAAGNGGQYIFVVPELELVAVFTGSNYGDYQLTQQPLELMQRYVIPAVHADK